MKNLFKLIFALIFMLNANAQDLATSDTIVQTEDYPKNFIKTNITSIALNNYSFQYERVLTKSISFAISYRFMPESNIPFKKKLLSEVGDDEASEFILNNSKISNMAITPEIRFYLGKGYGRGFYIAPYYRYAKFKTDQFYIEYVDDQGNDQNFKLTGDVSSHSGGIMFGAQWTIGKYLCIDWWILGAHYGSSKGQLSGVSSTPLSPTEQSEIRDVLEDFEIPLVDTEVKVDSNRATMKMDGPWAGIRAGISLGIRF